MFGSQIRRQRAEQAPALHHPLQSGIGVFLVQLQTQIGGQFKPQRHFFFFPGRGHFLGQGRQNLFLEAQLEKLLLVGFANDLELVEFSPPESLQNPLLVKFNDFQVQSASSGQRTILSSARRSASPSTWAWRLARSARAR